mgnify:CR=1 FL=1
MQDDTEELAGNYPDIAIYSEHASSTGLGLEIFSVDVALNITELSEEELESRMKEIIDQYSPILEGVEVEEIKTEIKQKTQKLRLQEQRRKHTSLKKPDVSLPLPVKI